MISQRIRNPISLLHGLLQLFRIVKHARCFVDLRQVVHVLSYLKHLRWHGLLLHVWGHHFILALGRILSTWRHAVVHVLVVVVINQNTLRLHIMLHLHHGRHLLQYLVVCRHRIILLLQAIIRLYAFTCHVLYFIAQVDLHSNIAHLFLLRGCMRIFVGFDFLLGDEDDLV